MAERETTIWSDEPAGDDRLDRERSVRSAAHLVRTCATPFVLGVYGSWGSGKTSFLKQMQRVVAEPSEAADLVNTVWFDSWRYQFDDEPVLGLLHCIRQDLGIKNREFTRLIMEVAFALASDVRVPYTSITLRTFRAAAEKVRSEQFAQREARAKLREYFSTLIARARTATTAQDSSQGRDPRRLVVFIDDLDRCRPDSAVRMLEALKIYLNQEGAVFVLGMDRPVIEAAIRSSSLTDVSERQYLDKIVQVPFSLPPLSPQVLGRFIKDLLPEALSAAEPILTAAGADNPRLAKRLVNGLVLGDGLVDRGRFATYDPMTLAGVQVVQQVADGLHRRLRRDPKLFVDVLEYQLRSMSDADVAAMLAKSTDGQTRKVSEKFEREQGRRAAEPSGDDGVSTGDLALQPVIELWEEHVRPNADLRSALILTPMPESAADADSYFTVAARTSADEWPATVSTRERARLDNYARPSGKTEKGRKYFDWMVFVDRPKDFRQTIREVEYLLHESFAERRHVKQDHRNAFELHSSAWGNFSLRATVRYHDGHEDDIHYYVDLSMDWPTWDTIGARYVPLLD